MPSEMAERLLDALTVKWNPKRHRDTYRERVLDLVNRKNKGEEIVVATPPKPEEADVVDLMAVLERSVKDAKGRRGTKRRAKSA